MEKISVFIITKNEAERIACAIKSVQFIADEILIIDSKSTDGTAKIAKKFGAKVIINEWPGYLEQKRFGESLCKNKWILNIDADEELSENLQNEIEYIFSADLQDHYTAYKIKMTIMHRLDDNIRVNAPYNQVIRLYNKKFWGFDSSKNNNTNDAVTLHADITDPKIYNLNEIAYHRSGTSIEQLVNKANFYSSEQAIDLFNKNIKVSRIRIIFEIPIFFFKTFFLRKYYVFGFNGFVDSIILAFARFLKLAKTREKYILAKINFKTKKH